MGASELVGVSAWIAAGLVLALAGCSSSDSSGSGGSTSSCLGKGGTGAGGSAGSVGADAGGVTPVAKILKPAPNQQYATTDTIVMQGSATDPQEGALTSKTSLFWFNDKAPNPSGEGTDDQQPALSVGTHTITFVAFDKECNMGSDQVSIVVQ